MIDFQDRLVEGHSFESREIRILPLVPLAGLDAECNPESGVVAVDHGGEKIQDFKLRVTPDASLPVGMFRFPVHLRAILVGGEVLPPVSIDVIGNVTTDIWALPSAVELRTRTPGQLAEEYVAIQSKSGTESVVEKIHGQCSEIDVESPPDRYAALHVLRVAARFGVAGTHSRLVVLRFAVARGK